MEELYVFGTGNAQAVHCYNTCFALKDEDEFFMVDAGGGNGILKILEEMNVDLSHIHHIFVTHEHTDHILGIVCGCLSSERFGVLLFPLGRCCAGGTKR